MGEIPLNMRRTYTKTENKNGERVVTTVSVVRTAGYDPFTHIPRHSWESNGVDEPRNLQGVPRLVEQSKDFEKRALERHNHYRATHGVPPLKWCTKCASHAREHAQRMARTGKFAHSGNPKLGENLFSSTSSGQLSVSAERAIDAWYGEVREMRFGEAIPRNLSRVGHFTQIVWKDTSHVGMAFAIGGNTVYVAANYTCRGNVIGEFHRQVFPPKNWKGH
ncbi:Golgi-associated plant pathogenesis-related protein 1 [Galendromus occidentalis]|uniref:Golgi-associated plant pathogenesis-related protein 1 n=1 Tax=Galendromus occidentalis TaxID=34638 RepID=A0AAJ7WJ91_9ACAR|nr:Golgi-associated plant pathogenesis-related protein 1 [Galendromus occidentalis]